MRKGKVRLDVGKFYECYLEDDHWNGWACPWFTEEVADEICRDMNNDLTSHLKLDKDIGCRVGGYHPPKYTEYDYAGESTYTYSMEEVDVGGQVLNLVPLGSWCWIWSEN